MHSPNYAKIQKTKVTNILKIKMKATSSSDAHCRTEDKVCGSVVIWNPFSFMVSLGRNDSFDIADVER
jgi:hypothetical protein